MPCPQTFDAYLPCLNSFYDLETRPLALWLVIRFVRYKRVLSSTRKSLGTNVKFSRFISCVNTLHLLDCGPHPFNLCRFGPKRALSLNQHIIEFNDIENNATTGSRTALLTVDKELKMEITFFKFNDKTDNYVISWNKRLNLQEKNEITNQQTTDNIKVKYWNK